MLTNADRELITAAVDGELAPEREAALHVLLARDPGAATLFACLKTDSRRLRALPRRPAPLGLADAVTVRVARLPRANPVTPRAPALRAPNWVPYAVAASLLFVVGAASFWVSLRETADEAHGLAQQKRLPRPDNPPDQFAGLPALPTEPSPELGPTPRRVLPQHTDDSRLATLPHPTAVRPESAPQPRPAGTGDVVGAVPLTSIPPFESVEARVPVLAPVADLGRKDIRDRIVSDLGRDQSFRLDLFVKDVPRAAAVFQSAARTVGLTVAVDAATQDRLRKKLPAPLAVYTDALAPDEVARLLTNLAKRDQADKSGPVFTIAHLVPFQAAEHRDLRDLFGVDLGSGKRKAGGSNLAPAAGTKAKPVKPAIVLTYSPAALRVNPAASKEVRAFLDRRAERPRTGVPLLVVIRPVL
ncbi:MAG TPA: hypothetical protein VFG68_18095 [Fimbriiglobus sp.]|nr:hypothetical protein [Fimbriiglobus sp.]